MSYSCMYCSRSCSPVNHTDLFCIDCNHFHIVRNEMLNELLASIEEERVLKNKFKEVQKTRKALERKYDLLWDKMLKSHMRL